MFPGGTWQTGSTTGQIRSLLAESSSLFVAVTMSQAASSSLSSKLHDTFEASLKVYEKKTETSLLTHPLMAQLRDCDSPADILAILSSQIAQTTSPDDRLIKWLAPVVKVLTASSSVISEGVGLVNLIQMILL